MSEEEIIENVKQTIEEYEEVIQEEQEKGNVEDVESGIEIKQAIQGLLDLYIKQKQNIDKLQEVNKYLQERLEFRVNYCNELEHELYENGNFIHKETIRNKIKELTGEIHRTKKGRILVKDIKRLAKREVLKELLGE